MTDTSFGPEGDANVAALAASVVVITDGICAWTAPQWGFTCMLPPGHDWMHRTPDGRYWHNGAIDAQRIGQHGTHGAETGGERQRAQSEAGEA